MVRFVHATPDRPSPWRRQARQACVPCRRRKKRCTHLIVQRAGSAPLEDSNSVRHETRSDSVTASVSIFDEAPVAILQGSPRSDAPTLPACRNGFESAGDIPSPNTDPGQGSDAHFVGDLNPESTFLADSPETARGYAEADGIGVWVSRRAATQIAASGSRFNTASSIPSPNTPTQECLAVMPTRAHYEALKQIYLRQVHKIFPVIDWDSLDKPDPTVPQVLSRQAVCLAAAAHPDAAPFLSLGPSTTPLPYAEYAHHLSTALRTVLHSPTPKDRLQLIPPLVIVSLTAYSSDDRHLAAELAALAVSYAQTVGLHHRSPPASRDQAYLERIFCCVWAMDRLTAALYGRPVLMHERDFGRDMPACFGRQENCFRLFLECVALLDGVIHLYRPTAKASEGGGTWELPTFEALVEKAGAFGVDSRLLVTLEALYHAIVILSCRAPSLTPTTPHVTPRESLSALSISSSVSESHDRISHTSFVPYAVSLALRTAYREMRASAVPTVRARCFRQLQETCLILKRFTSMYRPAGVLVDIVDGLAREVDRVARPEGEGTPRADGGTAEDGPAGGAVVAQDMPSSTNTGIETGFADPLMRLDAFESLDFEFDFDALDAVFGDGTDPCLFQDLISGAASAL